MTVIDLSKVRREKITIEEEIFRIDHSDWESLYRKDIEKGIAIIVSDAKFIKDNMRPSNDSLFDSRFNIPSEVDNKIIEYACNCEKLIGRYNEGQICPECKSVVEIRYSIELLRRGWIDLGNYRVILPSIYCKLRSYIGKKRLDEIINCDPYSVKLEPIKFEPSNPFKGIGLIEFERRYIEILEFFKNSSKKPELLKILLDRKDISFISKIYVMSSAHRPAFISSKNKTLNFHNINALFVKLLTDLNLIKKGRRTGKKVVEILGNIQQYLLLIHDLSMRKLLGKEKLIRSNIISSKLWYSSRMVIISETSNIGIDCVRMSYKGFIGMFELEIMNAMLRGYGDPEFAKMTTAECRIYITKCKYSNEIDEKIFSIIQSLIHNRKDDGIWVIINRNPSLDLGSIQCFKIADVFREANNYVLTIPHNSLAEYTGDYDGDCLAVFSPKEKCVVEAFKNAFKPSKLILDKTGGYYNPNMAPIKDEYAFIRSFCDKSYKPIQSGDITLRSVGEILKDIVDPFNYKKVKALRQLIGYNKAIKNGTYFDKDNVKICDPVDNIGKEKSKFYPCKGEFDNLSGTDNLTFDIFDKLDSDQFIKI